MSKWNGKACHLCGLGTLHDGKKTTNQYYREHCYTTEISGAFCDYCGDGVIDFDPAEEERWLSFRRQVYADEAAELFRIRKKLKLSQAKAARLAGGGKNAFSRYERGQAKPVAAVINLFKLLDKHPELIKELQ